MCVCVCVITGEPEFSHESFDDVIERKFKSSGPLFVSQNTIAGKLTNPYHIKVSISQ